MHKVLPFCQLAPIHQELHEYKLIQYFISSIYQQKMGCSSSSDANIPGGSSILSQRKPTVWFVGGGPGCQKGKVCEYLIRDYKFKYLSSYDMVQFEQERGGPDAQIISKLFKENKTMPSELIVRLVKKAIASCGIRTFLIDGFPNSTEDIAQFDKELTENQIDFRGYLNISVSENKMVDSGKEAYAEDKSKSKEQIEKNVRQIVKNYLAENEKIKRQYQKRNKYQEIDGQKGPEDAYQKLRSYLQLLKIRPPPPVRVFFAHFDDPHDQFLLCDDLVRKYGLYFYTPKQLIKEAEFKNNSPEATALQNLKKQGKEVPSSLVLSLIKRKIEKHDYAGNFLISGYPRTIADAKEWDGQFGWQTDIQGYLTFQIPDEKFRTMFEKNALKFSPSLKTEQISKKFEKYQANQSEISEYYKQKQKLLVVNCDDFKAALENIHRFFRSKDFHARPKISPVKLLFVSNLYGSSQALTELLSKRRYTVINMQTVLQQKIKTNGLYSQLIDSFNKICKPITGVIACRILLDRINLEKSPKTIVVVGFPNSVQQLQSWEEEVGDSIELAGIMLMGSNDKYVETTVKERLKNNRIVNTEKDAVALIKEYASSLEERVKSSDSKHYVMTPLEKQEDVEKFMASIKFQ